MCWFLHAPFGRLTHMSYLKDDHNDVISNVSFFLNLWE